MKNRAEEHITCSYHRIRISLKEQAVNTVAKGIVSRGGEPGVRALDRLAQAKRQLAESMADRKGCPDCTQLRKVASDGTHD